MAVTNNAAGRKRLLPGAIEAGLRRLGRMAIGGALVSLAVMGWVSLSTWSIHDPSLNHATHETPRNLLGYLGAASADLTFQSLGLAAVALFLPFAAWGWHLISGSHGPDRLKLRLLAWPVSSLMIAAGLAAFPAPARWPLPNGLGGIMGDLVLAVLQLVGTLLPTFLVALIGAVGFLTVGLLTLLFACGIPMTALALLVTFERREGSSAIVAMTLGALTHCVLSARAVSLRLLRLRPRREPGWDMDERDDDDVALTSERPVFPSRRPGRAAVDPRGRIEPVFDDRGGFAHAEPTEPSPAPDDSFAYPITRTEPAERESARRVAAGEAPAPVPTEYTLPPLRLMKAPPRARRSAGIADETLQENARLLESVLQDFGVKGDIINVRPGPVVTLYELEPAPGTKSSRVIGLADDIARSMSAVAARVAVIPGRNAIGIELPNAQREMVYFRELLETESYQRSEAGLALALGKTIGGEPVIADLSRMPHLLIAGTTGSGKSVGINTMILSLLYRLTPEQCRFIMVDPKMLELSVYDGIPHLLAPVVTDPKKAVVALKWTVREMEERYRKMSKVGVRNIHGYNARVLEAQEKGETIVRTVQTGFDRETGQAVYEQEEMDYEPFPYIVVIVDEMADLMMVAGKDIEGAVQRLAQMARAAGIHLITATQRPSVDVVTGTIKANFPTRISFQVTSKVDSRTILGEQGAEQLLGQGDMLYMAGGGRIMRVHGPFVSDDEVEKVVHHLKKQGVPEYLEDITEGDELEDGGLGADETRESSGDDLYDQAVAVVLRDGKVSTSYIQRRLSIGYNRAATLIERMEEEGLIGPANHAGKREILAGQTEEEAPY